MLKIIDKFVGIALFSFILFISCAKDNNPVDADDHDEHTQAVGCLIRQGDIEIARASQGVVTGFLPVVEKTESSLLSFYLVAQDGDIFQPDEDHASLAWLSRNPQVADVFQNETDGVWNFHLKGQLAGSTAIQFKIMHEDHADFVSLDIPAIVSQNNNGGL